jgi:lipopolysaccharide transport system permease protein
VKEAVAGAPEIVIRRRRGWIPVDLGELWAFRDLLFLLTWRDVKVRYKQTLLGAAWAVLQPVLNMAVFSLLFGRYLRVPSDGIPYPVFVFAGLLPWTYFSSALSASGGSLVASSHLITKVYFPRLFIPVSACLSSLLDFLISCLALAGIMAWYGIVPPLGGMVLVPLLVALVTVAAVGCGLWLSALTVEYRDFRYVVPFLLQVWMFVTPVIYPATVLPERFRGWLALNPMAGLVEAFRAAVLGHRPIPLAPLLLSSVVAGALLVSGLFFFRKVERSFADVI